MEQKVARESVRQHSLRKAITAFLKKHFCYQGSLRIENLQFGEFCSCSYRQLKLIGFYRSFIKNNEGMKVFYLFICLLVKINILTGLFIYIIKIFILIFVFLKDSILNTFEYWWKCFLNSLSRFSYSSVQGSRCYWSKIIHLQNKRMIRLTKLWVLNFCSSFFCVCIRRTFIHIIERLMSHHVLSYCTIYVIFREITN